MVGVKIKRKRRHPSRKVQKKSMPCCGRNWVTCGERNHPDLILNESTGQMKLSSISPLNTRREPCTSSTWSRWSSKTWQHKNNQTKITWAVLSKIKKRKKLSNFAVLVGFTCKKRLTLGYWTGFYLVLQSTRRGGNTFLWFWLGSQECQVNRTLFSLGEVLVR